MAHFTLEECMLKKLLVPIAFSKYSKGIIRFAHDLASPHGAQLVIANVVHERDLEAVERIANFGYKVDADKYIATIQQERIQVLEAMMTELNIPDDGYTFVFLAGDPTDELLEYIVENDIDMVVMGTKAKDIKHLCIGSVAERIFRRCPVPVTYYRGEDLAQVLEKKIRKELKHK